MGVPPVERLSLRSYAKVNLYLEVLGKRPDGYHEVETVLQSIDLFDSLELELVGEGIEVTCDNPSVPQGELNLTYKAAAEFIGRIEEKLGVRITIQKAIPVGGGLGGGSSNAASVLLGLNGLTGGRLSSEELVDLGRLVGSDVPFFLSGGTAVARGRGDLLDRPLPTPALWLVIIYPNFSISTQWAYLELNSQSQQGDRRFSLTDRERSANMMVEYIRRGDVSGIVSSLRNSFEEVVFRRYPELGSIKEDLTSFGALGALLSGTGSSLFGICEREEQAQRASQHFANSGYWVRTTGTLAREEVLWEVF